MYIMTFLRILDLCILTQLNFLLYSNKYKLNRQTIVILYFCPGKSFIPPTMIRSCRNRL